MSGMVAVLALITAACSSPIGRPAAAETLPPPAPPVVAPSDLMAAYSDDGLHRLVVSGVTNEDVGSAGGSNVAPTLPQGSTLIHRDGIVGYLDATGAFVPLSRSSGGGVSLADLQTLEGVESVRLVSDGTYAVVTSAPDALRELAIEVVPDPPFGLAADPYEPYQWALDNTGTNLDTVAVSPTPVLLIDADVDGTEAAALAQGSGVVVAVVDSGVDFSHPDLAGARWTNVGDSCGDGIDDDGNGYVDDCQGWDFGNEDNEPFSPGNDAHGTHVAGIIAASAGNGVGIAGLAPGVEIMDLAVQGPGGITGSSIARAIRYAVDNGADVINLSLGSEPGTPLEAVTPIVDAIAHANANGVLVVAAAGNHGVDLSAAPVYPAAVDAPNVFAVGAATPADGVAAFSNFGSPVDLFAPGELILSTVPGGEYAFMSGTSQASPIAAAAAALVIGRDPGVAPSDVIAQLVSTADAVDSMVGLAANGVRLNAARALGAEPDGATGLVTINGLGAASVDSVDAHITLQNPGGQFNQPFHWEVSLIAVMPNGVYGIIDHAVTVSGVDDVTDDRGAVRLAESDATAADLHTVLPAGQYALVVEAIPRTDPTVRLGEAYIARFDIGGGSGEGGAPVADGGGQPPAPTPGGGAAPPPTGGGSDQPAAGDLPVGSGEQVPSNPEPIGAPGGEPSTPVDDHGGEPGPGGETPPTDDGGPGEDPGVVADDPAASPSDPGQGPAADPQVPAVPPGDQPGPVDEGPVGEIDPPAPLEPVRNGEWAVTSISPRSGPVLTETLVTINGDFPEAAFVWFDDLPGAVVSQVDGVLLVTTPMRSEPGLVAVSLRTRAGDVVLEVPAGFEFVASGADGGTVVEQPGSGSDPAPGDPTPGGGDPAPVDGGTPGSPADDPIITVDPGPSVDVPDAPGGGPTDPRDRPSPNPQRQARAALLGDPVDLGNGLTGRPLSGLEAIGGVPACHSDPCRTRRITG